MFLRWAVGTVSGIRGPSPRQSTLTPTERRPMTKNPARPAPLNIAGAALAASALLLSTSAPAAADGRHPSDRTITVASFNIHHGADSEDVLDLDRIAADIESMDVDVIGLQEVDRHWGERSDFQDQAAELAGMLGMDHCYAANLDEDPAEPGQERRQYGTTILSKHRLQDCQNTPLPKVEGGEQRGLAQADLTVRGSKFTFYNTHLTHRGDQGEDRMQQFDAVNEIVAGSGRPGVLVGDLNATPDSPEYATFTSLFNDVWTEAGTGDGFTFAPEDPDRRIDYVLATPEISPLTAEVPEVYSSDHLPVVAEVTLPHPGDRNR